MIDDMSDQPHLGEPLEKALKDLPRVRLIRTTKRQGLVRARMLGASYELAGKMQISCVYNIRFFFTVFSASLFFLCVWRGANIFRLSYRV